MEAKSTLKSLGFSDKEAETYIAILSGGPDSVRNIATKAGLNRGTAYDVLKELMRLGAVSFYNKEKKQYFVAEPPEKLMGVVAKRIEELESSRARLTSALPELQSLYDSGGAKPTTKLYEGTDGVRFVLDDVLETGAAYCAYSSADLRGVLYESFPGFTKERIGRKIAVRVVAIGSGGGDAELAERRWLSKQENAPTYVLLYGTKIASISLATDGKPQVVVTDDVALAQTQRLIFDHLWEFLTP